MTILRRLTGSPTEQRAITPTHLWGSDYDVMSGNTIAGIRVSTETALNAVAFLSCVRLLSNDIAGLPVHAYRGSGAERAEISLPAWMKQPQPNLNITRNVYIAQLVTSLLTDGNFFIWAAPSIYSPEILRVLPPHKVDIRGDGLDATYHYEGRPLPASQVIHQPYIVLPGRLRGVNPVDAAREAIGLTIAADQYGSAFFGNGAHMGAYATFPGPVDENSARELNAQMKQKHVGARKAFSFGVLDNGGEIKTAAATNRDSEMSQLRIYQTEEMARLFGIPPHMIGSQQPGAVAYASVEQRAIDYVTHAVQPIVEKLEDAHDIMLRGQRTYFKFSLAGLLRADHQTRWNSYGVALDKKVIRRDEVRALEDLPFDPEATGYLETPNNNKPGGDPVDDVEPPRSLAVNIGEAVFRDLPAPVVNVEPPIVNVAPPLIPEPVVIVEPPDFTPVLDAIASRDVGRRIIERDARGQIVAVIEDRGGRVVRKEVERDADGRIIQIREVA